MKKFEGKPPPKPETFISGMTRDGRIEMKFSEPMIVPNFD